MGFITLAVYLTAGVNQSERVLRILILQLKKLGMACDSNSCWVVCDK